MVNHEIIYFELTYSLNFILQQTLNNSNAQGDKKIVRIIESSNYEKSI